MTQPLQIIAFTGSAGTVWAGLGSRAQA